MKFIWHKSSNSLSLNPITQVYGICFDSSGRILIMREPGKSWNIPGGTPKSSESPIQTLERELAEEVDVTISESEMVGYYEVISDKPTIYQLRFATILKEIKPQTKDPATNTMNERKLIESGEFFMHIKIEDYRPMLDESIKWYEKNKLTQSQ